MREHVGTCYSCGKEVFCMDGFLNGVITNDKKIICFDCQQMKENGNKENPQK